MGIINRTRFGIVLLLAMIIAAGVAGTASAHVWTDLPDYPPGSTVTISGDNSDLCGWLPGETVTVSVTGPNSYTETSLATVDPAGSWSCQVTLWDDPTAEGSYTFTAKGETSGVTQNGAFEDAYTVADDNYNVVENVAVALPAAGSGASVLWNDNMPTVALRRAALVTGPSHGTLALNNDGSFLYTPAKDYVGPDSFSYRGSYSQNAGFSWTVVGVATAHIKVVSNEVQDDAYEVGQGVALNVPAQGVLANDGLPDLGIVQTRAVKTSDVDHGSLDLKPNGSFTYVPEAGYVGTDTFGYKMQWSVLGVLWYDGGSGTVTITVKDTVAPLISVPADISVEATSASGAVVTFTVTAHDAVDGPVAVLCAPASGSTFPLGTSTVVCSAVDAAGNKASASFKVRVSFAWSGFQPPINSDGTSIFKLGSTVPVKFQLVAPDGDFMRNAVAKIYFAKISDGIVGLEVEAVSTAAATSGNLFRYDASSEQYVFNWGTKGLKSGAGTYMVRADLGDGVEHSVEVSIR
jgi:hypothetical protein